MKLPGKWIFRDSICGNLAYKGAAVSVEVKSSRITQYAARFGGYGNHANGGHEGDARLL